MRLRLRLLTLPVLTLLLAGCDSSSDPQVTPITAEADGALLRVSVATRLTDQLDADTPLDIDGVEVCQGDRCRRAELSTRVALGDAENDMGVLVGEVRLSDAPVTSVELIGATSPRSGAVTWAAAPVRLGAALELPSADAPDGSPYFPDHHLYLVLEPGEGGAPTLRVAAAAPTPAEYSATFLFDAVRGGRAGLDDGVSVVIGAGARARGQLDGEPTIFSFQSMDTGELSPQVAMSPGSMASGRARFRLPVRMDRMPEGASMSDLEVRADGRAVPYAMDGDALVVETAAFADLRVVLTRPTVQDAEGRRTVIPGGEASRMGGTCASYLQGQRSYFENYLDTQSYAVYTQGCVDREPNLHIIMAGVSPSRLPAGTSAPGVRHQMTRASAGYSLLRVDEHVANFRQRTGYTMVGAVNGFTWDPVDPGSSADRGKGAGGRGYLRGTVDWDDTRVSTDVGAEAVLGFTRRSGSYVYGYMARRSSGSSPALGSYGYTSVGSTTSLVVNGACTNSAAPERWSAIGYGNGIVMLVSSDAGDSSATAAELCAVFQAMGVTSAIRLDGASAAQLAFNGDIKNPNGYVSLDYAYWGRVRRVAYAVGITTG